jgi:hypothetical protein
MTRCGAVTHTVISNRSDGAWPIARLLAERFDVEALTE